MGKESYNLIGFSPNKMDAKGRVAIKVEWRNKIDKLDLRLMKSTAEDQPVLRVMTDVEFDNAKQLIEDFDGTPSLKRSLSRRLFKSCVEVKINDQGKLTIPKLMQEEAGIAPGDDLVLVANDNYIDIMSKESYAAAETVADEHDQMAAANAELGIF